MPFVAKQNQMLETDVLRVNSSETNTSGHVLVSGVCPVADTWYLVVEEDGGEVTGNAAPLWTAQWGDTGPSIQRGA